MSAASRELPRSVRLARTLGLVQSGVALAACGLGALYALLAHLDDARAARAGNPNQFAGLGEGLGLWFAGIMLLIALGVGVPALLLCRRRSASAGWPLLFAAEAVLVVIGVQANGITTASTLGAVAWTFTTGTGVAALAALVHPTAGRWALHLDPAAMEMMRVGRRR